MIEWTIPTSDSAEDIALALEEYECVRNHTRRVNMARNNKAIRNNSLAIPKDRLGEHKVVEIPCITICEESIRCWKWQHPESGIWSQGYKSKDIVLREVTAVFGLCTYIETHSILCPKIWRKTL